MLMSLLFYTLDIPSVDAAFSETLLCLCLVESTDDMEIVDLSFLQNIKKKSKQCTVMRDASI